MSSQPTPSPPLSTLSTSPSPSPHHSPHISDDEKSAPPSPSKPEHPSDPPPPSKRTAVFPSREDCWSEDATRTLIEAWGSHYLELNRGNLRHNHWQAVADAVNAIHGTNSKLRRTDVQCKNRIDTIKKKYKIEKSKTLQSNDRYVSTWPHFHSLDPLIGVSFSKQISNSVGNRHSRNRRRKISESPESSPSPPHPSMTFAKSSPVNLLEVPWPVPVGPRSKRAGPGSVTKRNFSVMAAAAAAVEAEEDEMGDHEDSGAWGGRLLTAVGRKMKRPVEEEGNGGYRRLAEAITKLGKIYENVEMEKQRLMVELEEQRMEFFKDLEKHRMKVIFMESEVQLGKLKRAKHHSEDNSY